MSIIIQGIAYDEKSSFQKGSRKAPPLIRKALYAGSMNLYAENGKTIEQDCIKDLQDFSIKEYFEIEKISLNHLKKDAKLFTLGGDHSITYPIIKAYQQYYPKLDILHIDAHADLYDAYEGDPYSHACPFARIMEQKLACRLVQVGIRTLNDHQSEQAKKFGVEIHEMRSLDLTKIKHFENPLYISVDMDGLDPAYAPGVSHHEAGGLSSRQLFDLIQNVDAEVVGADLVEYNPERDVNGMTSYLAAKLMKELLAKML